MVVVAAVVAWQDVTVMSQCGRGEHGSPAHHPSLLPYSGQPGRAPLHQQPQTKNYIPVRGKALQYPVGVLLVVLCWATVRAAVVEVARL